MAKWSVVFTPVSDPGPYQVEAELGSQVITLSDVLYGDVWLCSGQSNMVMKIYRVNILSITNFLYKNLTNNKGDRFINLIKITCIVLQINSH